MSCLSKPRLARPGASDVQVPSKSPRIKRPQLRSEIREVNGIGHGAVSRGQRVKVIARVVRWQKPLRLSWVANRSVKVDYRVEMAGRPNPLIHECTSWRNVASRRSPRAKELFASGTCCAAAHDPTQLGSEPGVIARIA